MVDCFAFILVPDGLLPVYSRTRNMVDRSPYTRSYSRLCESAEIAQVISA